MDLRERLLSRLSDDVAALPPSRARLVAVDGVGFFLDSYDLAAFRSSALEPGLAGLPVRTECRPEQRADHGFDIDDPGVPVLISEPVRRAVSGGGRRGPATGSRSRPDGSTAARDGSSPRR